MENIKIENDSTAPFFDGEMVWNPQLKAMCHVINPTPDTVLLIVYTPEGELVTWSVASFDGSPVEEV